MQSARKESLAPRAARPARGLRVSETRRPIIDVVYGPTVCEADLDEAFAAYAALSALGAPVGYLIDMRACNPLFGPAKMRRHAAELFRKHYDVLRAVTVCEARVVGNGVTRGIVTAFDWLTGTKWPCATFTDLDEAEAWVRERLVIEEPPPSSTLRIPSPGRR